MNSVRSYPALKFVHVNGQVAFVGVGDIYHNVGLGREVVILGVTDDSEIPSVRAVYTKVRNEDVGGQLPSAHSPEMFF